MAIVTRLPSPIGIFGQGLSGRAVKRLLSHSTIPSDQVFLFDEKSLPSGESLENFLEGRGIKTLVVSPGVPLSKPEIQNFVRRGGVLSGELDFAFQYLESERVLCVTGSVGKSTVSALLQQGLLSEDPDAFVGGNFGHPLADYVAEVLEGKRRRARWLVLELSSYQLENFPSLRSDGTIITSLLANHLERYPSKEAYYASKWTLVEKTRGPVVFNNNGSDLREFSTSQPEHARVFWTDRSDEKIPPNVLNSSKLLGDHNKDNLAVAFTLLRELGLRSDFSSKLTAFEGLPHRVENCGVKGGVLFVNDSKATTMSSVFQAVNTIESRLEKGATLHLLLGGRDKNLPWHELHALARPTIKSYFFGEFATKAKELSGLPGDVFPKLSPAILSSLKSVKFGDIVLLSPGGSSLDEFSSFEERGRFFKNEIAQWTPSQA